LLRSCNLNYFGKELMNDGIVKISSKSGLR